MTGKRLAFLVLVLPVVFLPTVVAAQDSLPDPALQTGLQAIRVLMEEGICLGEHVLSLSEERSDRTGVSIISGEELWPYLMRMVESVDEGYLFCDVDKSCREGGGHSSTTYQFAETEDGLRLVGIFEGSGTLNEEGQAMEDEWMERWRACMDDLAPRVEPGEPAEGSGQTTEE